MSGRFLEKEKVYGDLSTTASARIPMN
jgi:hypothetical protein